MTDRILNILLLKLKLLAILMLGLLVTLFSFSFTTSHRIADDLWQKLGMTKTQGVDGIKQSFLNGYLNYYAARNAKNIAFGNRAAVAKDLLIYTKQYISSDAFKKEYELLRKNAKPQEPQLKEKSKEDIRREKIAETEKSLKETQEVMKQPNMKSIMEPTLQMLQKNLKDFKDPGNKMIELYYQSEKMEQERRIESFKKDMTRWEKDYPDDFREVVIRRLQKYLELASTVDFSAELKVAGKKKKFVNPAYEGKAYDWKQIYRAGKEVYDVAKPFAEQWINELNKGLGK